MDMTTHDAVSLNQVKGRVVGRHWSVHLFARYRAPDAAVMTSRMSSVGRRFRRHARYNCGQASIMDKLDGFGGWPTRRRR